MPFKEHNEQEKKRWNEMPEPKPEVWFRYKDEDEQEWLKLDEPSWQSYNVYIVDDEFAEMRKQFIDNPTQIEYFSIYDSEWQPIKANNITVFTLNVMTFPDRYRIKGQQATQRKPEKRIPTDNLPIRFGK